MPKISVIIPVYNTEKYLQKCLNSLVNQTLDDIEIICINDGSTDNSKNILENYAKKDSRIKIIDQPNSRQGVARNNGFAQATGEYIGYVDSDDWIDLNYFEKLYITAKEYDADIALATNIRVHLTKSKKRLKIKDIKVANTLNEKFSLAKQWKNECPTNKIYRRKMLIDNQIVWPEGVFCEDKIYTTKAVFYANKIVTVPGINYYYFDNPTSTVNKRDKNSKHVARREVLKFLREQNVGLEDKKFWAKVSEIKFLGFPLLIHKESIYTEADFIFGLIKFREKSL